MVRKEMHVASLVLSSVTKKMRHSTKRQNKQTNNGIPA